MSRGTQFVSNCFTLYTPVCQYFLNKINVSKLNLTWLYYNLHKYFTLQFSTTSLQFITNRLKYLNNIDLALKRALEQAETKTF